MCTPGYLKTAYWENVKTGEVLWAFSAFRVRGRESERGVISSVWEKVKVFERLAEYRMEPLWHGFKGYEDEAVRKAIEGLSWADFWVSEE